MLTFHAVIVHAIISFILLLPILVRVDAQTTTAATAPVWGQCGGSGWSGPTGCPAGSTCTFGNPFYSQCIPGAPTSTPTPTQPTTSSTPSSSSSTTGTGTSTPPPQPTSTDVTNPYVGYNIFLIPEYIAEVKAAVGNITNTTLAAKAATIEKVPVFFWMDVAAKVPTLGTYLAAASATGGNQLVQAIIYDLPDRDCAAQSSAGELGLTPNGTAAYKAYIDGIAAQVTKYPTVRVVLIIEPDGLANLVTNMSIQKCAAAAATYKALVAYAISKLQQPNAFLYLDAGHAGWLGWPANIAPAAQMFGQVLAAAGPGAKVRGLATDVSNYNLLRGPEDPAQAPNPNYDEEHYINALAPLLAQNNYPAHFIVDQSRSGVSGLRTAEGDWCNVKGAGLGMRPTTNTGNTLIDAIVWAKPPGESDGTSNTTSARYDTHCGQVDATQPAPEAGTWFQNYFEALVQNANPAL